VRTEYIPPFRGQVQKAPAPGSMTKPKPSLGQPEPRMDYREGKISIDSSKLSCLCFFFLPLFICLFVCFKFRVYPPPSLYLFYILTTVSPPSSSSSQSLPYPSPLTPHPATPPPFLFIKGQPQWPSTNHGIASCSKPLASAFNGLFFI